MSRPKTLSPEAAFDAGLRLFAAWPCPPSNDPKRGWPSREWEARYRTLRRSLLIGPQPVASEAVTELFELQRELSRRHDSDVLPPDVQSQWEEAFAVLGRTADSIERRAAS